MMRTTVYSHPTPDAPEPDIFEDCIGTVYGDGKLDIVQWPAGDVVVTYTPEQWSTYIVDA